MERNETWLMDAAKRAAPLLAREGVRVLVTVAVALGLLTEACGVELHGLVARLSALSL